MKFTFWEMLSRQATGETLSEVGLRWLPYLLLIVFVFPSPGYELRSNEVWKVTIGCSSDSSPAVASDGMVVFGAWDGTLRALNKEGSVRWTFEASSEIRSSPAIGEDGRIYFGSRDRSFYVLHEDGRLAWKYRTGGWVDSSPALAAGGRSFVGSWDGKMYAFDAAGAKRWAFQTGGPIVCSPAISREGHILFGSHDQHFYALNQDGSKLWDYSAAGPILSSPAIGTNGCVIFTSADGWLHCLNSDGSLRWKLHTGGVTESSPVIAQDGTIFVGVNKHLWAVSSEGEQLWQRLDEDNLDSTPLLLRDATACFISRYGMVKVVSQDKGNDDRELLWMHYLYFYGFASPGIAPDGTLYFPGKWTQFYALPNASPLSASAWPKFRGNMRNTGNALDNN